MVAPSKRDFVVRTQVDAANSTSQATMSPSTFVLGVNTINTTTHAVGSNVVLSTSSLLVGNSTTNATIFSTAITIANSTSSTALRVPTVAEATGNNFLHANGSWVNPAVVPAVGVTNKVYQKYVAGADQTVFTVAGGFGAGQIDVFYNGAHLANDEYTASSPTITLTDPADAGAVVEAVGWIGAVIVLTAQGGDTEIQINEGGNFGSAADFRWQYLTSKLTIGDSTTNVSTNSSFIQVANSTAAINVNITGITGGNSTSNIVANTSFIRVANSTGFANITPFTMQIANSTNSANVTPVSVQVGNSTINASLTLASMQIANATANTTVTVTPSGLLAGNTTVNTSINLTGVQAGNTTVNVIANTTFISIANSTGFANITPTDLRVANTVCSANISGGRVQVGNSTVSTTIGQTGIIQVGSNTLTLGTSTKAANGYTFLPNGLILQWGWVAANTTAGNITFPVAFPTAVYSYTATSNSTVAANVVAIIAANTTTMNVRSISTAVASNSTWMAIGS